MNVRQRKLQILREMKALKRKFNRLSEMERRSRRGRMIRESHYGYAAGSNHDGDYLVGYYQQLGEDHASSEDFSSKQSARKIAKAVGNAIVSDLIANKSELYDIDFEDCMEAYIEGIESGDENGDIDELDLGSVVYDGLIEVLNSKGRLWSR